MNCYNYADIALCITKKQYIDRQTKYITYSLKYGIVDLNDSYKRPYNSHYSLDRLIPFYLHQDICISLLSLS